MDLDSLKKLCDEATPGPWSQTNVRDYFDTSIPFCETHNYDFVSAARQAMPKLISIAKAAQLMLNSGNYIHEDFGVTALEKALAELEHE